jgi:hypothetical protein
VAIDPIFGSTVLDTVSVSRHIRRAVVLQGESELVAKGDQHKRVEWKSAMAEKLPENNLPVAQACKTLLERAGLLARGESSDQFYPLTLLRWGIDQGGVRVNPEMQGAIDNALQSLEGDYPETLVQVLAGSEKEPAADPDQLLKLGPKGAAAQLVQQVWESGA